jgi:arylsulfatase A-like enzyme
VTGRIALLAAVSEEMGHSPMNPRLRRADGGQPAARGARCRWKQHAGLLPGGKQAGSRVDSFLWNVASLWKVASRWNVASPRHGASGRARAAKRRPTGRGTCPRVSSLDPKSTETSLMTFRRAFRTTAFAAFAALAAPSLAAAAPPQSYNVVFVLVDDLRFDAMGFLTPGLDTPNIDFLAKNGVYFPNAVVTSALCSPSRATILTGQSARNHRMVDNNGGSEAGLVFFPEYLRKAGYQTAFFGKWHMGEKSAAPRPGFDRWVSFTGQGTYFPTEGLTPQEVAAGKRQVLNVDGREVPRSGYITDELTDYALDWLKHGRNPAKPFFLYLSHKAVHSDPEPPPRYARQYADLDVKLPASVANTEENNRGKPMWVRNQRNSYHGVDFLYEGRRTLKDYVRDYYRTLSPVDESLGRLLAYLKASHLERRTLVLFYSDNGFLFGDHGLIDKRNAYEPSIRVPMLAYAPGLLKPGVVNPARVRNLDLAPTFLDLAGLKKPAQFEGRSFLPVATGEVSPDRWQVDDFIYEYYWEWTYAQTPTTFAIERGRMKYIQYHGVWDIDELYDLERDPREMRNLTYVPAYQAVKADLRRRLYQALADRNGEHVVPYTERLDSTLVARDRDGAKAAEFPPEWLTPAEEPAAAAPAAPAPDATAKLGAEAQG